MLLYTTTPTAKKRGMNRDIYNEEKMCVLSQTLVFSSSFLSSLSLSSCAFIYDGIRGELLFVLFPNVFSKKRKKNLQIHM